MSARALSPEQEIEVAICYLAGLPISAIVSHYPIHRASIQRLLVRLGIDTERGKRLTRN